MRLIWTACSVATVFAAMTACGGSQGADKTTSQSVPPILESALSAKQARVFRSSAQDLEWTEQEAGIRATQCAALRDLGDTRASRCFRLYPQPLARALLTEANNIGELQQTLSGACQAAARAYATSLVDEADALSITQRAGVRAQKTRFARATRDVASQSLRAQRRAATAYTSCAPPRSPPLNTARPLPAFALIATVLLNDTAKLTSAAFSHCVDLIVKQFIPVGSDGCDVFSDFRGCQVKAVKAQSAEAAVACSSRFDIAGATRYARRTRRFFNCITHIGDAGAPTDCGSPPHR